VKPALMYLGVLAGGGAVGAVGMGAYNAVVVGVPAEEVVVEGEAPTEEESHEAELPPEGIEPGAVEDSSEVETPPADLAAGGDVASVPSAQGATEDSEGAEVLAPQLADADSLAQMTRNYQRLSQIFAAMQPEDAAAVLEQLDDAQLEGILLAMQGRNAAPILAEMEPVRAAALSRRVLEGGR